MNQVLLIVCMKYVYVRNSYVQYTKLVSLENVTVFKESPLIDPYESIMNSYRLKETEYDYLYYTCLYTLKSCFRA